MKTKGKKADATEVAKRIAGEDLQIGDYITVLNELYELPSFLWGCTGESLPAGEPVKVQFMSRNAGVPHQVKQVCLPFVYAKTPQNKLVTFDIRRHNLVRLHRKSARSIWSDMTSSQESTTKSSRS